ncbi:hypothetical protein [Streptomyces yaizuensis]|uniref:Sensor domain-containing protein n=1 Tax=Streptomyces yaizuensis TaxID=2989713 RepID=A0ABQ5P1Y3_9ACTN|nr:hypothetical protein [Streptomyces sp. YSPA8]GLF96619.1 hypothetical protein SYYSPA8_20000 [Streptomyces sp. YSPA8]
MTASTHDPHDHHEYGEGELRTLLELGTPRLTAPDGRIGQIRGRVARRRRYRAGAAVLTATVLAVGGTLVPDALREEGRSATRPAAPPPLTSPTESDVRFADLYGLTVTVPTAWHTLEIGRDHQPLSPPGGFIGTQALSARPSSCVPVDEGACPPLQRIGPRDVLIRVEGDRAADASTWDTRAFARSQYIAGFCEQIGGGASYAADFAVERKPDDLAANIEVCMGPEASTATLGAVRAVVDSARFGTENATPAPRVPPPAGKKTTAGTGATAAAEVGAAGGTPAR